MERVFITNWIMETAQKIDTMIFGVRFSTLAKLAIDEAKAQKKKSRQNNYSSVINSFMEFRGGRDIRKKEIGNPLLHEFRKHLEAKGLKESTIACYLKNLGYSQQEVWFALPWRGNRNYACYQPA